MKVFYKLGSWICLVIFIAVLIPLVNLLINFREKVSLSVGAGADAVLYRLDNDFLALYAGIFLLILSALLAIFFTIMHYKDRVEGQSVVYIENDKDKQSQTLSSHQDLEANPSGNFSSTNIQARLQEYTTKLSAEKQKNTESSALEKAFTLLCKHTDALQGALFMLRTHHENPVLEMQAGFAYFNVESQVPSYGIGEGLVGQAAKQKQPLLINHIPEGYIKIISGLGQSNPKFILFQPLLSKQTQELRGVAEIAFFALPSADTLSFIASCSDLILEQI